jgi:predicted nucleotidyltransferase
MASEATIAVLRRYLKRLLDARLPVKGLVLYGSYARGDERPTSDIDVILLLDDSLSDDEVFHLWPELDYLTHEIDNRIETWPVTVSRFQTDEVSPLIIVARQEGIPIAA